ncbi:AAA family ATPase [Candidatus Phytoplasma solani]|uniref:AAA family ATPase n=1 Tax=Candidatus Phytoplasma solani TaxID=69896 RepID=UPI00358E23B6
MNCFYHKKNLSTLIILLFLLFGYNLINVYANDQLVLSTKITNTNLGELEYRTSDRIKKAIKEKNSSLTDADIGKLQVNDITDTSAKITPIPNYSQFSGEVEIRFTIKPRLSSFIQIEELGEILATPNGVKKAIKDKNPSFEPVKATITNITDVSAKVNSTQGTGEITVTFTKRPFLANVIVDDSVKDEFRHIFNYIKNFNEYQIMGATCPKGFLLTGPPGTGKTYLIQQLKDEIGDEIYYKEYAAPEFINSSTGVSEAKVRNMFKEAREQTGKICIIAIDEIDSILSNRGSVEGDAGGAVRGHNALVNQFLTDLDGLKQSTHPIIVIGMTNKVDMLDSAIIRPGRLEKKILIDLPNKPNTRLILEMYLKKIKLNPSLTIDGQKPKKELLDQFTDKCYELKMSPASIKYLTQEAARIAIIKQKRNISSDDLTEALDKYEKELLKKSAKPQNLSNKKFSIIANILFYIIVAFSIVFVLLCIYFIYRKYRKNQQMKNLERL